MLSKLSLDSFNLNIVDLIGYYINEDQRFLVYEYMTNRSLGDRLFRCSSDMKPLERYQVDGEIKGMLYV